MGGTGTQGGISGGSQVPFKSKGIQQLAQEIAGDELAHVSFLRSALGSSAVSQPSIDLVKSFTAAAQAAGVVPAGTAFDPFANEEFFLLGAFIFEDVGVTAYKGAAPLISSKTYLDAAAGILSVEAYHAAAVRTRIYDLGLSGMANKISAARGALDDGKDQGVTVNGAENIVPADANSQVFGRTPGEVLNIVYLTPKVATSGGFYPDGVNGVLNTECDGRRDARRRSADRRRGEPRAFRTRACSSAGQAPWRRPRSPAVSPPATAARHGTGQDETQPEPGNHTAMTIPAGRPGQARHRACPGRRSSRPPAAGPWPAAPTAGGSRCPGVSWQLGRPGRGAGGAGSGAGGHRGTGPGKPPGPAAGPGDDSRRPAPDSGRHITRAAGRAGGAHGQP